MRSFGFQGQNAEGAGVWSGAYVASPPSTTALASAVKTPETSFSPRKAGALSHPVCGDFYTSDFLVFPVLDPPWGISLLQ